MAEFNIKDVMDASTPVKYNQGGTRKREKMNPLKLSGGIAKTKKPLHKKLWDLFVGENPKSVKDHLIKDVLIPGLKNAVLDTLSMGFASVLDTLSMGFFGKPISRGTYYGHGGYGRTNYAKIFSGYKDYKCSSYRSKSKEERFESMDKVDYRNIVLNTRADAENVVDYMRERIDAAGSLSVAEFFDLLELPSRFTDNDWGWTNPNDIGVKRVSSGFLIDVTEAYHLE